MMVHCAQYLRPPKHFPRNNLVTTAQRVGASAVVVISVDRPLGSWVKITLDAYDVSGSKLWTESDSEGGVTAGGKVEKALEKIKAKIASRLGTAALPLRK